MLFRRRTDLQICENYFLLMKKLGTQGCCLCGPLSDKPRSHGFPVKFVSISTSSLEGGEGQTIHTIGMQPKFLDANNF